MRPPPVRRGQLDRCREHPAVVMMIIKWGACRDSGREIIIMVTIKNTMITMVI